MSISTPNTINIIKLTISQKKIDYPILIVHTTIIIHIISLSNSCKQAALTL